MNKDTERYRAAMKRYRKHVRIAALLRRQVERLFNLLERDGTLTDLDRGARVIGEAKIDMEMMREKYGIPIEEHISLEAVKRKVFKSFVQ